MIGGQQIMDTMEVFLLDLLGMLLELIEVQMVAVEVEQAHKDLLP